MKRTMLLVAILLMVSLVVIAPTYAKTWKFTPYSVGHMSDGRGLTNGSLSLHRVYNSRHPMLDTFNIYGTTYTWARPADSTFLMPGWTSASTVSCAECHDSISADDSLPLSAYPDPYETLRLSGSTTNGMTLSTVICAKCHDLANGAVWSNEIHESSKHRGQYGACISCHVQLPHGSGVPRLLGYSGDPAPYSSLPTGLAGIKLQNYTPTSWRKGDCTSSCHGAALTPWPSGGSVAGTVRTAGGAPISGATVGVAMASSATNASGVYGIARIGAGYTTVIIDKAGYYRARVPVTITSGTTVTVNATLTVLP